jgi:RNA polymerase sigma-70 factor (ECF subfamily)
VLRLLTSVREPKAIEPADSVLAIAAVVGNLDAFGELVRRYRRAVERIAAGIAGPQAAEDIAQEAFLLAFKALPDLDEPDRFAAWLYAITRNRALRWARKESRMLRVEFDDALLSCIGGFSTGNRRDLESAVDLAAGIDELPENLRLIMRLRWLDEMPMQQISAFTGLPLSTVKWRLHEGKRLLRETMKAVTGGL